MRKTAQKLICLNLALFLLAGCFFAGAAEVESNISATTIVEQAHGEVVPAGLPQEQQPYTAEEPRFWYEDDSYQSISVNGIGFRMNQDRSGNGWRYEAEGHDLYLENYQGAEISASGDLWIYASGTCRVTAGSWYNGQYGNEGIGCSGYLGIVVRENASFTVTGGYGSSSGGNAVLADSVFCSCYGSALFQGGNTSGGTAGDALGANRRISLYGAKYGANITATGGSANMSTTYSLAGFAVRTTQADASISIDADCTLTGGNGYYARPAVYYSGDCSFDAVNATLKAGTGNYSAGVISGANGNYWYYSPHSTLQQTTGKIVITANSYGFLITGGMIDGQRGRLPSGQNQTSLWKRYGSWYDLRDYLCTLNGYTQTGWITSNGNLLPLLYNYVPQGNDVVDAQWTKNTPNKIALIPLEKNFNDETNARVYFNRSVVLPSLDEEYWTQLGWCTEMAPTASGSRVYGGQWYAADDEIMPNAEKMTTLYGLMDNGLAIRYHSTLGQVKNGGTMIIQGNIAASAPDLQVYTIGEEYLTAPEDYRFAGWSRQQNASSVDYKPNTAIMASSCPDLYAVWEKTTVDYTPVSGVQFSFNQEKQNGKLKLSSDWCNTYGAKKCLLVLYDGGKMVSCVFKDYRSGQDLTMELSYAEAKDPILKVFALDGKFSPVYRSLACNLGYLLQ